MNEIGVDEALEVVSALDRFEANGVEIPENILGTRQGRTKR